MEGCAPLKVWECILKVSTSGRIVVPPLVQTHPAKVMLALCEGGGCVQREGVLGRCVVHQKLGLTFLQHM